MEGECNRKGKRTGERVRFGLVLIAVTTAMLMGVCGLCGAFDIPTGSDDWTWRWDQSFRYTLTDRLLPPDPAIIGDRNSDDGDRNIGRGIASNRLDLLSETDIIYKKDYGVRFSGAAWSDFRYWQGYQNNSLSTYNQISDGHPTGSLSDWGDRYNKGGAELLDAFAFGKVDACNMPSYWKVGRHMEFWGEALLTPFLGISVDQGPLDLAKAISQPGVTAKEVFRPENNFSFSTQVSSELTFMAQAFFQWERDLAPEDGTFFASSDLLLKDPGVLWLTPKLYYAHGDDVTPDQVGDFGVGLKWSPQSNTFGQSSTFGLYYRRFSDRLPQIAVNTGNSTYTYMYPNDIDLVGLSYSTVAGGISWGSEFSFRHNMPLVSGAAVVTSNAQLPSSGDTLGARGDTMHALVNALGLLKKTPIWDSGSWNIEMCYSRWLDVTENEGVFSGRDSYNGFNRVTPDNSTIAANFSPQWLQIYPGVDLSLPITANVGMWGVSAVTDGGGVGDGSWGVGLQFDILNKYQVLVNYVSFFGPLSVDPLTGAIESKGSDGPLRDRDIISLTVKAPF